MMQKATFGMGCFWEPDDIFSSLDGVEQVIVGYAGGTRKNPTHTDIGDHTETIQIEYNSDIVSYNNLLDIFWQYHDPTIEQKRQYRSVIFFQNTQQEAIAQVSLEKKKLEIDDLKTIIETAGKFYEAEDFHQKYLAKLRKVQA